MEYNYQDRFFKILSKDYQDKIQTFITCKCIPPEEIKDLQLSAISSGGSRTDVFEIIHYCQAGDEWLRPKAKLFSHKLKTELFGNHYARRDTSLFSVFSIESLNEDGTIANPHLHYICEENPSITQELVTDVWQKVIKRELPPNPIDVQHAPFRKGAPAVIRYTLKFTSPEFPADIYPHSEAFKIKSHAFGYPELTHQN